MSMTTFTNPRGKLTMSVRVRFAPSPTGLLHLGGARTALFNFLYARANGGTNILRVEDTDKDRYVEGSVDKMRQSLKWLGVEFDEGPSIGGKFGPYVQSERLHHNRQHAQLLLESGAAYCCFCSRERLETLRSCDSHVISGYDGHCRGLSRREVEERLRIGEPHVVRLKVPHDEHTQVSDCVYGNIDVHVHSALGDLVLLKSDGRPTYHLANVVDDHLMEISHVMRGEEWLLSTAIHLQIYSALKWQPPKFVHLPLLLSSSGGKLSKRNQDVYVETYKERGYLPEAMVNFLSLLGWTPPLRRGDKPHQQNEEQKNIQSDIYDLEDLVSFFSLDGLTKRRVGVNEEKLLWINKQHFKKKLSDDVGLDSLTDELKKCLMRNSELSISPDDPKVCKEYLKTVLKLLEDRVSLVPSIPSEAFYFWRGPTVNFDLLSSVKMDNEIKYKCLDAVRTALLQQSNFSSLDAPTLNTVMRSTAEGLGVSYKNLMQLCRICVTGVKASPTLTAIMVLLGQDTTAQRLEKAMQTIRPTLTPQNN